jgi:hypothetical protein
MEKKLAAGSGQRTTTKSVRQFEGSRVRLFQGIGQSGQRRNAKSVREFDGSRVREFDGSVVQNPAGNWQQTTAESGRGFNGG